MRSRLLAVVFAAAASPGAGGDVPADVRATDKVRFVMREGKVYRNETGRP